MATEYDPLLGEALAVLAWPDTPRSRRSLRRKAYLQAYRDSRGWYRVREHRFLRYLAYEQAVATKPLSWHARRYYRRIVASFVKQSPLFEMFKSPLFEMFKRVNPSPQYTGRKWIFGVKHHPSRSGRTHVMTAGLP